VTYPFDSDEGLIGISARLYRPKEELTVRLALDTGATGSLVNTDLLLALGDFPPQGSPQIKITTGSGVESVTETVLERLEAVGRTVHDFWVVSHTLPETAGVDGPLGLDFFRGQ
jgi:hypothetical protein